MKTPKKIIYPKKKQKEILAKVKKILKPFTKKNSVVKILIFGSLVRMELGKYPKKKYGSFYSDIDVNIVVDGKIRMPSSFKLDYKTNVPPLSRKEIKNTKKICERYSRKRKLEHKFPLIVHIINPKIHDIQLANKYLHLNKKDTLLVFKRNGK